MSTKEKEPDLSEQFGLPPGTKVERLFKSDEGYRLFYDRYVAEVGPKLDAVSGLSTRFWSVGILPKL